MNRFRRLSPPRGGSITTFVLAVSAVSFALGCMDDAVVIGQPASTEDGRSPADLPDGVNAAPTAEDTGSSSLEGIGPAAVVSGVEGSIGETSVAPAAPAASAGGPESGQAPAALASECWQLPVVDGARILAASGRAADLVGGKIVGSLSSPTNGFVDLGVISAAPAEGEWLSLALANATAYRYVKYYGPGGSYGAVADVELYAGEQRLEGAGFGSAGSRDGLGSVFANALDGDATTFFEGPLPNDNYVGLDLGAGHELAAPSFSPPAGAATVGELISVTAAPGAIIRYTTDGSDPAVNGAAYTSPVPLPAGSTLIKAVAAADCALPSPVAQSIYSTDTEVVGAAPGRPSSSSVQSSMHIGNSLTDTINDLLPTLAADGGIALDYNRYTIPGAGTWLYDENPTGGFGVPDVQEALRTRPFDHLSMQPYPNWPCQPVPSSDGDDSDSGYLDHAWTDAMTQNPNVQFWVYQQWPAPTDYEDCLTGGSWTRGDWAPDAPTSWEDGVANGLTYQEVVRSALISLHPEAPPPYIVPGGLGLVALKHAIEDGQVPGFSDFFGSIFLQGGADIHLTVPGAYLISLVFYASMFQVSPEGLPNETGGALSAEQAAVFQRVAWETVVGYPLSGVAR
jgi:Fn3 associated